MKRNCRLTYKVWWLKENNLAQYYINVDTGNDSTGTGTALLPWKTISKALTASTTNDTINLQAAVAVYPWTGASNTITPRTFIGASFLTSVIDHGSAAFGLNEDTAGGTYNFSNLTFQNALASSTFGLYMQATQNNVTVNFTSCAWKNIICGTGFMGGNGTGIVINLLACLLYNLSSVQSFGNSIFLTTVQNSSIINCTIYSTAISASVLHILDVGAVAITLKNNIIYTANAQTFLNGTAPVLTTSANNNVIGYTSIPTMTGTISVDPLFVDVGNLNFNLRPGSPSIDTGVII